MEFTDDELNVMIDAIEKLHDRVYPFLINAEYEDRRDIVESVDCKLREELRQRLADQSQELNMGYE